ncbi:MAG: hypothetical protein AAF684_03000, partial [Pseudomonadota bacterium]
MIAAPAAADEVTITTERTAEFDRIVFQFPTGIGHQSRQDGDRVILTFDRPLVGDLLQVQSGLSGLVSRATLSVDERTARLTLTERRRLVSASTADGRVIVDLIRIDPGPEVVTSPAGGPPVRVPIRVGEHPTYGRVVFDWPRVVGYTVTRRRDDVLLEFDAPGRFDTAPLAGNLPTTLRGLDVERVGAAGVRVVLQADPGAEIRHFRSGPKVVVDVLRVEGAAPPP